MIGSMMLPANQDAWLGVFAGERLDVIPDPMVMRIADLFIGGRSFAVQARLEPARVWEAIERNVDSLLTFFHLLMTRDRIPLIDYEYTFANTNFEELGELAVNLHPPIYQQVKEQALLKLATIDLNQLPIEIRDEMAANRQEELKAVGYDWFPNPGNQFVGPDQILATMLLGGLIFGGYAQISGSDHVLGATRSKLMLQFTKPDAAPLWGTVQEERLFGRLNAVVSNDPRLTARDVQVPPTVLPYLLVNRQPKGPRDLLVQALRLREEDDDFAAYRRWHGKLRRAWSTGYRDEQAENDVAAVTSELTRRYPPDRDAKDCRPIWSREIGIKLNLSPFEFDFGKINVAVPDEARNWLVEGIGFRNHRKVLLRMALARRQCDNLLQGLKRIWTQQ